MRAVPRRGLGRGGGLWDSRRWASREGLGGRGSNETFGGKEAIRSGQARFGRIASGGGAAHLRQPEPALGPRE